MGLKPTTYGLGNRRSFPLSYVASNLVVGVGIEPTTSGFSDQRCYHLSYPTESDGGDGRIPTCGLSLRRRMLSMHLSYIPMSKASRGGWIRTNDLSVPSRTRLPGCATPRFNGGVGGTRTHNDWFAGPAPCQFGYDPKNNFNRSGGA